MKRTGTLKVEIIKPIGKEWDEVGERMHALTRTLTPALNFTMRELYPEAIDLIGAKRKGDKVSPDGWRSRARACLRERWTSELAQQLDWRKRQFEKESLKPTKSGKERKLKEPDSRAYVPVVSDMCGETVNLLLLARFSGEHLRDLVKQDASFPSWSGKQAFYTEGRSCHIEGSASQARLRFPLYGMGSKSVTFAVDPSGSSDRARWRKLVRDFKNRPTVVDLERTAKTRLPKIPKECSDAEKERLQKEIDAVRKQHQRALLALEEMGAIKLGRIGIKHDSRRGKWYALISWTEYVPERKAEGQTAAVNFGINVFAQALAEDGTDWSDSGNDIRVTRGRFAGARRSIQRSIRSLGRGSRGHGKQRRYLALTKKEHAETRWTQTRIRQHASDLINWCQRHNVSHLVMHDLSGQREQFEKSTKGEAHAQMKRFIHSWPFYATQQAIIRQAEEFGMAVELLETAKDSQRCPSCGHTDPENMKLVDGGGEYLHHDGKVYRSIERWVRFECRACETKGKGDFVTCINMLQRCESSGESKPNPLGKMQETARKRARSKIKTENRRKG